MKELFTCFVLLFAFSNISIAQKTITGVITDGNSGEPLIGATVLITETGKGTSTGFDGSYSLVIRKKAKTLTVSYIGYITKVVTIEDETILDIGLDSGELLDELVVVGYGTIEKSDKTGAISSIRPEGEDVQQYDDFQDYLQGRASGVQILSNGNELLSPSSIRIRGANSLRGDNEPLFVVDGIIINSSTEDVSGPIGNDYLSPQNGLTGINPQDIESIEILKDASSTAIYGSRGANGVVIITTKKGKSGKTKFNYKASTRIGKATNLINMLDSDQYVDYINDSRAALDFGPLLYRYADGSVANAVVNAEFMEANSDSIPRLEKINWYDDVLKMSVLQNHRLSASGGTETSNFYIGLGYLNAKGLVPGTESDQGDFLLKYTHNLTDKLTISPRVSTSYTKSSASKGTESIGGDNTALTRQLVQAAPLLGYSANNLTEEINDVDDGPRAWLTDYNDDGTEFRALASMTVDYKISESLSYRLLGGADFRTKERKIWYGSLLRRGLLANGEAGIGSFDRLRYNVDHTLNYKKAITKRNRINATLGFVVDKTSISRSGSSGSNFSNESLRYDGISFAQVFQPLQFDLASETILSFLGRINYSFDRKYLFTASFRRDGSSKFSEQNRWSLFPSAAFAWKINEESFLKDNNLISEAKIRLGYGRTGSQAINPYQTLTRFTPTANLLSNGSGGVTAVLPQNIGNPNLKWETTDQFNVGLDFGFNNDRITGNVDYYIKKTTDLLQVLNIGPSVGFETVVINKGSLQNTGIELGLNAHVLNGPIKWDVFGTISFNKNRILDLGVPEAQFGTENRRAILGSLVSGGTIFKVPANIFIEGEAAGLFWGYQTDGIIQDASSLSTAPSVQGVASQLGDVRYVDQNGDGNISDLDLTVIGDPNPDFNFGLGSSVEFKGISLSMFFNGVQGNQIANGNSGRIDYANNSSSNIRSEAYLDAWSEDNLDGNYPRLNYDLKGDFTDRMVEDGSFIRLSFVSLAYTLPASTIKGIDNARLFISGHNLMLITKYTGFDPEVNSFSFDPTRVGIDWNSFPNQKSISFGINLDF